MNSEPKHHNKANVWDWFISLVKIVIRNPAKGSKAILIVLYALGGIGFIYFVFFKLNWAFYNPAIATILSAVALFLYLLLYCPLIMIWTKFDKRLP